MFTHIHNPPSKRLLAAVGDGLRPSRVAAIAASIVLLVSATIVSAASALATPVNYHAAAKPITDDQGRKRIIIDFVDAAKDDHSRDLLLRFDPTKDRQQPQVVALASAYEKALGFKRELMTTWVGASVTAYLSTSQIEKLKTDPNIALLTEDRTVEFSQLPPPFPNTTATWNGTPWGELNEWGGKAVNAKSTADVAVPNQRKIYIIDSGVAFHSDLGSVSQRVNVGCGTGADCTNISFGASGVGYYAQVGCYAHATHVAGIIGATKNNGLNRHGIYAGANMVSVGILTSTAPEGGFGSPWISCGANQTSLLSTIGAAFDYIYSTNRPTSPIFSMNANVVNLSMNGVGTGYSANGTAETNRTKLLRMVNPAWIWVNFQGNWIQGYYPGALFAQSAGNQGENACLNTAFYSVSSPAYLTSATANSTDPADGIMVIGAINSTGAAVTGPFATTVPAGITASEPAGSNKGDCVDIWAPGDLIYSTWGEGFNATRGNVTYSGGQPSTFISGSGWAGTSGWAWLSGTSMAAPHVAAAAAYVADKFNLTTPAQIEQKVRDSAVVYSGFARPVVRLPN